MVALNQRHGLAGVELGHQDRRGATCERRHHGVEPPNAAQRELPEDHGTLPVVTERRRHRPAVICDRGL